MTPVVLYYSTRGTQTLLKRLHGVPGNNCWLRWDRKTHYRTPESAREQGLRMIRDGRARAFKIYDGDTCVEHWVLHPCTSSARRVE